MRLSRSVVVGFLLNELRGLAVVAFALGAHHVAHAQSVWPLVAGTSGYQNLKAGQSLYDGTNPFGLVTTAAQYQTAVFGDATHIHGVGPGTSGQCLTSNGAAADPSFQACSGGGGSNSPFTYTVPALSSFTWVNQGTATATQTTSGQAIYVNLANNASLNWRILDISPPATPYKAQAQLRCAIASFTNSQDCGIYFYDGTKLEGLEFLTQGGGCALRVERMATVNTDTSTQYIGSQFSANPLCPHTAAIWAQIRNDGTNLSFDISQDGQNYVNLYSEAVGAWLTPTKVGFGGASVIGSGTPFLHVDLLNWATYSDANLNGQ